MIGPFLHRVHPASSHRRQLHVPSRAPLRQAARAIAEHEKHYPRLADDTVVHVVVDGKSFAPWDYLEHNARQPKYRHRVWALRQPG